MTATRFRLDLLHPGAELRHIAWVDQTWQDWFTGPDGPRRLALVAAVCGAVLVVVFAAVILPTYWRLSTDLNAIPGLRRDLKARQTDLGLLRSNLGALSEEAKRQVRWAELLGALSQEVPATLRLQLVDAVRVAPRAPGQSGAVSGRAENVLRIDAVTPLRAGSPPLLEVAQFMAGLMRDPAVNTRFQLKGWEMNSRDAPPAEGGQLLTISITLAERPE